MPTTSSNSINPKRSRFDEPTLAALVGFKDKRAVLKAAYQRKRTSNLEGTHVGSQLNGDDFWHTPLYMDECLEPRFINPENDLVWYWSRTPTKTPPHPGIVTVKADSQQQQHTVDPLELFSDPYHVRGYRKPLRLKRKESIQEPTTTSDTDSDSDRNTMITTTFAGGADRRKRHNHGHGKTKKPYTKGMHIPPLYSHC